MTASGTSRPPLDRAALAGLPEPWRVEVVEETASTNGDVAERARAGEPAGLVLVAEHQTAGRGRLGRSWETPPRAALTFSVLLRPSLEAERWPWLPLVAGVATARAVRASTGLSVVGVKWPNDVLVAGGKVAGILLERVESEQGSAAVVGIGVNVSTTTEELPVPTATSLALHEAHADRGRLLAAVLTELRPLLDDLEAGRERFHASYVEECETLGQTVEVALPSGDTLSGRAVGIDRAGRLHVETGDGSVAVGAGDVVHVRGMI